MNKDIAIKVENLSKVYKLYNAPIDRMKEALHPRKKSYHKEFYALNDVSFEVKKGETVGIVGRNGSGKSTILKIITGVLTPTSGSVVVNGKVSALLELGSGFNPEYTGMENIYFQGNLMGYSRDDMELKLQNILEFADIGDFIHQPYKSYSSGMAARLAFAVAINVEPDILIVDEALSVGDAAFQRKCFARMEQIKNNGATILFVSHALDDVAKNCSRTVLLNQGHMLEFGESRHVVNVFRDLLFGKSKKTKVVSGLADVDLEKELNISHEDVFHTRALYQKAEYRWGMGGAKIIDYALSCKNELFPKSVKAGSRIKFRYRTYFERDVDNVIYGFLIKTVDGVNVYGTNSVKLEHDYHNVRLGDVVDCEFSVPIMLNTGKYFISFGVTDGSNPTEDKPLDGRYDCIMIVVVHHDPIWGRMDLGASFNIEVGNNNE